MRKKLPVIIAYLALLILALPVPLLHHYRTDRAIEAMRPAIKLDDGSYSPMLMPSHILFLRWLGSLSQIVPFAVFAAFVLSFWREVFARPATLCAVAICQCAFTTLYALYSTLLLGMEWLHRAA
jgi:hypothetical protein